MSEITEASFQKMMVACKELFTKHADHDPKECPISLTGFFTHCFVDSLQDGKVIDTEKWLDDNGIEKKSMRDSIKLLTYFSLYTSIILQEEHGEKWSKFREDAGKSLMEQTKLKKPDDKFL